MANGRDRQTGRKRGDTSTAPDRLPTDAEKFKLGIQATPEAWFKVTGCPKPER